MSPSVVINVHIAPTVAESLVPRLT
jgi:hypothetical protein